MRVVFEHIYERGKRATKYLRRRIPADLRSAYPKGQTHITRSLHTSDLREAKGLARIEEARIEAEFEHIRHAQAERRGRVFAGRKGPLALVGATEIAASLALVQARSPRTEAPLEGVLHLLQRGESALALATLQGLLAQGGLTPVPSSAMPSAQLGNASPGEPLTSSGKQADVAALPTWDDVFAKWRDYVPDRPKSTAIATQTPWRALQRFMNSRSAGGQCCSPALVVPLDMTEFVEDMRAKGLAVDTLNERLSKVKAVYKIAVGRHVLQNNPALHTLGLKESSAQKRRKRRLPFDTNDLSLIFGSSIFTRHLRSSGQSGEASYWLPVLMFYTGARPEEIAGMALTDIIQAANKRWYFDIVDRPSGEDHDLFDDIPATHRRTLKNGHSIRRIPVAQELIDLGLLRYVEWLRGQGSSVMFPTLEKDWHCKLSGAFSKFFGRFKRSVGILDDRKVMYSFRHTFKDLLERAAVPSKYLQRLLGHTSGDGSITDGYGSDLPFDLLEEHFLRVRFPSIPALPWEPGKGSFRLKGDAETIDG